MLRERTGHPPSCAEAKEMKSLTLHIHACLRASLKDWSSSVGVLIRTGAELLFGTKIRALQTQ